MLCGSGAFSVKGIETYYDARVKRSCVLETDPEAEMKLKVWKEDAGSLTAEKIYRYIKNHQDFFAELSL